MWSFRKRSRSPPTPYCPWRRRHSAFAFILDTRGRGCPVCGELLILGKSVIRHTQLRISRALTGVSGEIGTPKKLGRSGGAARLSALGAASGLTSPTKPCATRHGSGAETPGQANPRAALRALSSEASKRLSSDAGARPTWRRRPRMLLQDAAPELSCGNHARPIAAARPGPSFGVPDARAVARVCSNQAKHHSHCARRWRRLEAAARRR